MATQPIPVKAADLRRTDVAWHREAERFAVVSSLSAVPGTEEVQVNFLGEGEALAHQRYRADEEVSLKRRGINAERVIERLCVPLGEKASAWRSERRDGYTFHAGFTPAGDGYQFVAELGAWENGGHIRLLPDGGQFPFSFSLTSEDPGQRGVREPMKSPQLTGRLRNALLGGEPELAERVREELRCAIGGLDLTSEERHVARGEGGYALQVLTEEVSGLEAIERPDSGPNLPNVTAVLLAGALESVDFEAIADELITEIEEGPGT